MCGEAAQPQLQADPEGSSESQELVGERLRYTRLTGTGPSSGWVSLKVKERSKAF